MRRIPESTKELLELAYRNYHRERHRNLDPISLVHRYPKKEDQEVVALFTALLSYGNVKTILQSVERLLKPMGTAPRKFLGTRTNLSLWPGFRHRFTTGADIEILAHWVSSALRSHGTLENYFMAGQKTVAPALGIKGLLSQFVQSFSSQPLPLHLEVLKRQRARNLKYLVSDPIQGSACKRLNMFLRWMIRPNDGIDLGLWTQIHPRELMLPVDTHLLQTLQKLRWTRSKQANWKVVESATEKLRLAFPEDPIRYDFALCHLSMSGGSMVE